MSGYAINEPQSKRLHTALLDLSVQAEAKSVFMSDRGGNIIAQTTQQHDTTIDTVAALAAGSFCATRELARMIGEPEFHSIFHQGEKASIYIQSTVYDILVLVIFGKETTPGLVKLYTEKTCVELTSLLEEIVKQNASQATQVPVTFKMNEEKAPFVKKQEAGQG
ncbi:MAG: roadblock/LC7 domain-containing protein [Kiritimatiellae bacterium]|nr:roadblock/LC7 domain-containing protein [Kiritimatiellia bacterium]